MPEGIPANDRELLFNYDPEETYELYLLTKELIKDQYAYEIPYAEKQQIEEGINIDLPIETLLYNDWLIKPKVNRIYFGSRYKNEMFKYSEAMDEITKRTALIKSTLFKLNQKGLCFEGHQEKAKLTIGSENRTMAQSSLYPIDSEEVARLELNDLYSLLLITANNFPEEMKETLELFEWGKEKNIHIMDLILEDKITEQRGLIKKKNIFRSRYLTYQPNDKEYVSGYIDYIKELQNRKAIARKGLHILNQERNCFSGWSE